MIEVIKDILFFIAHPSFWSMNEPYCAAWDDVLNELMKKHKFIVMGNYYAKLGSAIILWIANYPYSCMAPDSATYRASRRTIYRAHRRYLFDTIAATTEENR